MGLLKSFFAIISILIGLLLFLEFVIPNLPLILFIGNELVIWLVVSLR